MRLILSCLAAASKHGFTFGAAAQLDLATHVRNQIMPAGDVIDTTLTTAGLSTTPKTLPVETTFLSSRGQQES